MLIPKYNQMQFRHWILSFILLATLVAAIYPKSSENLEVVEPKNFEPHSLNNKTKLDDGKKIILNEQHLSQTNHWDIEKKTIDLFYVKSLVKSLPPQPAPSQITVTALPPPIPAAPPLPFVYVGKLLEDDKLTVFVSKSGKNYILKDEDLIDGIYSVKSIEFDKVVFEYLPLKQEQVLIYRGVN